MLQKIIIAMYFAILTKAAAVLFLLDDPEDALRRLMFAFAAWWFIKVDE